MYHQNDANAVTDWVKRCLHSSQVIVTNRMPLRRTPAHDIWECTIAQNAQLQTVIVKVFKPTATNLGNASLSAVATAQKCALAGQEICTVGIPTPRCLGMTEIDQTAAIIFEKLQRIEWQERHRLAAARSLAILHTTQLCNFSHELQTLVQRSDPKQHRTYGWLFERVNMLDTAHSAWSVQFPGVAAHVQALQQTGVPVDHRHTIVHGDFFSANIIPTAEDVYIIDWETCAIGDPMWDLAFLIGADSGLVSTEVDAVLQAYRAHAPIDHPSLLWHKQCWDVGWALRKIWKHLHPE